MLGEPFLKMWIRILLLKGKCRTNGLDDLRLLLESVGFFLPLGVSKRPHPWQGVGLALRTLLILGSHSFGHILGAGAWQASVSVDT